jgi:hypothetical protein
MSDSARLVAVKEATERVREGMVANARGERALDIGAALATVCDAVDELADVLGAALAPEAIEPPDRFEVGVDTVAHPPPPPPDLYADATRCEATIEDRGERRRCELRRGHPGRHRARRDERVLVQWGRP